MKLLYKSRTNRVFSGVLGGLGEYFNIDPVILRLAFVLLMIITALFPCMIAYGIAILLVPSAPEGQPPRQS